MNLLDFLILIPICYFCYRGFINGIIKEVLSIAGIILAVFMTFQYMDPLSTVIKPLFNEKAGYIPFISGAMIFIGTISLVQLVAFLMKKFLETINLNFINRFTGLAFGFLKGGIMVSAILLILAGFNLPSKQARDQSLAYPYIIYLAPEAYNAIALMYPGAEDFSQTIEKTLEQYNPIKNFPIFDP